MSTTASVVTPSPRPSAPRDSSAIDVRASGDDLNAFDRQLDTARQQHDSHHTPASSNQGDESAAARHQPTRATHDRAHKSATKSSSRHAATAADTPADPASQAATSTPTNLLDVSPDAAGDSKEGAAANTAADTVDGSGAAALVGAMLALLPSASAALQGLAGAGSSGKAAAKAGAVGSGTDGSAGKSAVSLLPMGDAGASAPTLAGQAFVAGKADLSTLAAGVLPADDGSKDAGNSVQASALQAPSSTAGNNLPQLLQVQAPVGSSGFGQELGQQVAWLGGLSGQGVRQASIRLNPQELGPLDVKVSMDKGRVDVVFSAQHPAAVTAVQQTLPQLDHMLAQHGLSLGHAEVGQQQQRPASQHGHSRGGHAGASPDGDDVQAVAGVSPMAVGAVSLLDAFA